MDIKEIRKKLGMNQAEFGEIIGVSRQTVISYEKGETIPEAKMLFIGRIIDKLTNSEISADKKENDNNILKEPELKYQTGITKEKYIDSLERIIQSKDNTINTQNNIINLLSRNIELLEEQIKNFKEKLKEVDPPIK